jgi:glucosamine-6-phosphate deaminase
VYYANHAFSSSSSPKNTHLLDGEAENLYKECEDYEQAIRDAGGIDLFLGGIGAGR